MSQSIEFIATVQSIKTLADHGIRLTLDLPESAIKEAAMSMECKRAGVALQVNMTPIESKE